MSGRSRLSGRSLGGADPCNCSGLELQAEIDDHSRPQCLPRRFRGGAHARRRAGRRRRGGALPPRQALGGLSVARRSPIACARPASRLSDVDHIAVNQDSRANLLRKLGYVLLNSARSRHGARPAPEPAKRDRGPGTAWRRRFPARPFAARFTTSSIISRICPRPFTSRRSRRRSSSRSMASAISPALPGASGAARTSRSTAACTFPHSLGIFYQALTQYLGFPHYGDEYKVMGLAPYGQPALHGRDAQDRAAEAGRRLRARSHLFPPSPGADVPINGTAARPNSAICSRPRSRSCSGRAAQPDDPLEDRHRDIARSVQAMYEEAFFHLIGALQQRYGLDRSSRSPAAAR